MSKFFIVSVFVLFFAPHMLRAQDYSIDVSGVQYPEVKYDFNMGNPGPQGKNIEINSLFMTCNGEPVLPVMGEFHYSRYDHRYWKETLLKMKASGINIVSTYALWIYHEEMEGRMDWTGNNNLREFVKLCNEVGLMVHLRIGPYCNAECRNGGLPDWLMQKKHIQKRCNDPIYLAYVQRWYRALAQQVNGLLYKDGGPIMGIQLENEYVKEGQVVPHLMELKRMAIEEGFDVPVYSMTHWMASDYPKKEIVPYAGYYIETPWSPGTDELPVGNFQFFTYNRLSDNIGTDLIKMEGDVQSLNSQEMESPYFTCEIGVGTASFYRRRPIVPEEMAGANINLRLGCGVNLMGYYMYSGGSHKVGKLTTLESSTSRISYDYQAPLKEFGTIGSVMPEIKKYNYFMNDFGAELAPQIAYLPTSNNNTDNLQWAIRAKDGRGFLFCSNYLYKRHRKNYNDVQFQIKLKNETLKIPREKVSITDGAYFLWPFNLQLDEVELKYATTQPITKLQNGTDKLWVFFEDDQVAAEYFFNKESVKNISVSSGRVEKETDGYFVSGLTPGTNCLIKIEQQNGQVLKILTLTEEQSDKIWKVENNGQQYLALTESGVFVKDGELILFAEENIQDLLIYPRVNNTQNVYDGIFSSNRYSKEPERWLVDAIEYRPMEKSWWIKPAGENTTVINKAIDVRVLSKIKKAILRCAASQNFQFFLNDEQVELYPNGNYFTADLSGELQNNWNNIKVVSDLRNLQFIGEIEVLLENGRRLVWNTDQTWETVADSSLSVELLGKQGEKGLPSFKWQKSDGQVYYEIRLPVDSIVGENELRLSISFKGDRADAYLGEELIHDYLYDGTDWIIGINRFNERLQGNSLVLRAKAFNETEPDIYFEKSVESSQLDNPRIKKVELKPEYRFYVHLN